MLKTALIIGSSRPWIDHYRQELRQRNIRVEIANPMHIALAVAPNTPLLHRLNSSDTDTDQSKQGAMNEQFDIIIPLEEDYEQLYYSVAIDAGLQHATMLNRDSILSHPNFSNKFYQYQLILQNSKLDVPSSYYSFDPTKLVNKVDAGFSLVKFLQSSRGRGVFRIYNGEQLIQLQDEFGKRMMVQEFIQTKPVHDYRTIVLNGKAICTFKKYSADGLKANNAAKVERVDHFEHENELAELAASFGINFCGIDYALRDNGRPVIFEINRFPYFHEFHDGRPTMVSQVIDSLVG